MSDIKVSLVLPSLNVEPYIRECMESVIGQTLQDIEIICVDAGSTDGTLEVIEACAAKDPRIKIIRSERKSYGYQMNLGLDTAQGEYIGIVETDDFVDSSMYETLYRIAKERDAEVVTSDFYYFMDDGERRRRRRINLSEDASAYGKVLSPVSEERPYFFLPIFTWNAVYRRSFLKKHNVRYHESQGASYQDNGFFFQVYAHARRMILVPAAFYMLRRDNRASSVFRAGNMVRMMEEYRYIKNVLSRDAGAFHAVRYEYAYRYVESCLWAFDNMRYRDMEGFLEEFRKGLLDLSDAGLLRYDLFDEKKRAFLFAVMHDVKYFAECEIAPKRRFYEGLCREKEVIVYGAGKVGQMVLDEISVNAPEARVIGIAVSQRQEGEKDCRGIPVHEIHELLAYRDAVMVVVAVRPSLHGEIRLRLETLGFRKMCFVDWKQSLGGKYRSSFVA